MLLLANWLPMSSWEACTDPDEMRHSWSCHRLCQVSFSCAFCCHPLRCGCCLSFHWKVLRLLSWALISWKLGEGWCGKSWILRLEKQVVRSRWWSHWHRCKFLQFGTCKKEFGSEFFVKVFPSFEAWSNTIDYCLKKAKALGSHAVFAEKDVVCNCEHFELFCHVVEIHRGMECWGVHSVCGVRWFASRCPSGGKLASRCPFGL
jgi:hypothetical protein